MWASEALHWPEVREQELARGRRRLAPDFAPLPGQETLNQARRNQKSATAQLGLRGRMRRASRCGYKGWVDCCARQGSRKKLKSCARNSVLAASLICACKRRQCRGTWFGPRPAG